MTKIKTEKCSCGAEQEVKYRYINETRTRKYRGTDPALIGSKVTTKTRKLVPYNRNELICHCDTCGKKWGEHIYPVTPNIKFFCVACSAPIKDQTTQRYTEKGNYCNKCNAECDHARSKIKIDFNKLFNNLNYDE